MKGKGIGALVFDAYGTLFDVQTVISACNILSPEKGPEINRIWRAKQLEYSWLHTSMGQYKDFWEVTESGLVFACKSLELECSAGVRRRLMDAYLHLSPYPDVLEALRELAGFKRAILSNGTPAMLRAVVGNAGMTDMFVAVLSAHAAKHLKPDPRVYALAPERLHLAKSRIGFVSSNFWDIAGAAAFGFPTFWINRSNLPPEELDVHPHATVGSLAELARLLAQ